MDSTYDILMGPMKVLKILVILLTVSLILYAFFMVYANTLIQSVATASLNEAKLSYDSGYYDPLIRTKNDMHITVKAYNIDTGEEISKDKNNLPAYGDIMKVEVTVKRQNYNIFSKAPLIYTHSETLVNRGAFGDGYKYERK